MDKVDTAPKNALELIKFFPFIKTIKKYRVKKLKADFIAALTVAIIALPQSMAYAIIAGVHPKYGLYAAIIPTIISSLFGSSKYLIAGPTNAISMVVASSMTSASIAGIAVSGMAEEQKIGILFLLAFMVGIIQLFMGVAGLGKLINFVSHSVVIGFTAGAGVLIAFNQLKNFLGLSLPSTSEFIETLHLTFSHLGSTNLPTLGLGIFTIVFILVSKRLSPKIPAPLLAMVLSAVFVAIFDLKSLGVKSIGQIPQTLPPLSSFPLNLEMIKGLFMPAMAIAVLGVVEALSIAKSIANTSRERIDGNQEFIGQGLSNISAGLFSSIPGSGSFTRSAVNFKAGAATRFAGVFSGLFVMLTIIAFAPFAKYIPIASLAGILMVIAYSMIDKKGIVFTYKTTKSDRFVLVITILATLFLELEIAIYIGALLSIALFLKKVSHPQLNKVCLRQEDNKLIACNNCQVECPQISFFEIDGSLFFGAIDELEEKLISLKIEANSIIIIRMKGVHILDATGAHALEKFLEDCEKNNIKVIYTNVKPAILKTLQNSGLYEKIGRENITLDTTEAIRLAVKKYADKENCKTCVKKIFKECLDI